MTTDVISTDESGSTRCFRSVRFTLIELMVAVAVIAILIALLLPVLHRAKEQARRVICLGNQKQLALGVGMYAVDNSGKLPEYNTWASHMITSPNNAARWGNDKRNYLLAIVGDARVLYCPSHRALRYGDPAVGWNGTNSYRYISYSPIGIWEQSSGTASYPKHYTLRPLNTSPILNRQGNRPERMDQAEPDLALSTDSQISWDARRGVSFTIPGDGKWTEESNYYNYYAYPHRDRRNAWAGGTTVYFDGSAEWRYARDSFDYDPRRLDRGAEWIMHYRRGVYEGLMFW